MKGSITIRIYLRDYRKARKAFPGRRGESAAAYFERLAEFLEVRGFAVLDSGEII